VRRLHRGLGTLFRHGVHSPDPATLGSVLGYPWTDRMATSGSFYGATVHGDITRDDEEQARALGSRTAQLANYLRAGGMTPAF